MTRISLLLSTGLSVLRTANSHYTVARRQASEPLAPVSFCTLVAACVDQFHARARRVLRLGCIARSLMVCLIIAIPLKSFSQTCENVQWIAGNNYPPGPYSSPNAVCATVLNGLVGGASGWGPNAYTVDTNAVANPAGWGGVPTGGYPGSITNCNFTQTFYGCRFSCPDVMQVTNGLPSVSAVPDACPQYWVVASPPRQPAQTCSANCVGDPINPAVGNVYRTE
jgi:hypothetical protein